MEIIDYLRIARRRLAILILLPVLAGGGTAAYLLSQPRNYQATATVEGQPLIAEPAISTASAAYSGGTGVTQFANAFIAAATSSVIASQVSVQTHVPQSTIIAGLTVTQVNSSAQMTVTYTSTKAKNAAPVARAVASDTLAYLFGPQVTMAQRRLEGAQQQYDALSLQLKNLYAKAQTVTPDQTYQALQQEVANLQQQEVGAQAAGRTISSTIPTAGIAAALADAQARMTALAPYVEQFQTLSDAKTVDLQLVSSLQQSLQQAKGEFESANPASILHMSATLKASRLSTLVKTVVPAAALGLAVAIGVVLLLELMRARKPTGAHVTVPDQGTVAAGANGHGDTSWLEESFRGPEPVGGTAEPSSRASSRSLGRDGDARL